MVHGYFVLQVLNVSLVVWVAISCLEIDGIIHLCCKNNVSTNAHVWLTLLLFITYACTYINTNFWAQTEAVLWLIPFHSLPPLLPFSSPFLSPAYHRSLSSALTSLTAFVPKNTLPLSFPPPSPSSLLGWPRSRRLISPAALLPELRRVQVVLMEVLPNPVIKSE